MTIDDIAIFNRMSASETFRPGKAFERRSVDVVIAPGIKRNRAEWSAG